MAEIIIVPAQNGWYDVKWKDDNGRGYAYTVDTIRSLSEVLTVLNNTDELYKYALWLRHGAQTDWDYYHDEDWVLWDEEQSAIEYYEEPFMEPHRAPKYKDARFIRGKVQF